MEESGFTHEYEGTSSESEGVAETPAPKKARSEKQKAATANALARLAELREQKAAEKKAPKVAKKAEKPIAAKVTSTPAASAPAPVAAAAPAQQAPNPYAHASHERTAFDPMLIAELVKREIEVQKLREREIGWKGGRTRRRRRADTDSDSAESSDDDRPSRTLSRTRSRRRPVDVMPPAQDPRDAAGGASEADFFDRLMTRNSKFNPW
jgi:hypothetical protein